MYVAQMHDSVGGAGPAAEGVEVFEVPAQHLGPGAGQCSGRGIGAGEAHDLVAGPDELGNDSGADEAGPAGDEETHGTYLLVVSAPRALRAGHRGSDVIH